MGGYVAFETLRRLQAKGELHRVKKLALLNTSARADTPEQRRHREGLIKVSQMGRFKGVTPRLLPQLLAPRSLEDPAITGLIIDMAATVGQEGFVRQQQAILSRPSSLELLQSLTMPTLVIGGEYDKLSTPDKVVEMAQLIPGAQLHMLKDCGHVSPLEQPAIVTGLLADFFAA